MILSYHKEIYLEHSFHLGRNQGHIQRISIPSLAVAMVEKPTTSSMSLPLKWKISFIDGRSRRQYVPDVEKTPVLFLSDLLSPEISYSHGSFSDFLKIACLHVSFTAYENFYRLSKNALSSHLLSTFSPSEVSEIINSTIKHISTYTLVHSSISTHMGDHFLVSFCP